MEIQDFICHSNLRETKFGNIWISKIAIFIGRFFLVLDTENTYISPTVFNRFDKISKQKVTGNLNLSNTVGDMYVLYSILGKICLYNFRELKHLSMTFDKFEPWEIAQSQQNQNSEPQKLPQMKFFDGFNLPKLDFT